MQQKSSWPWELLAPLSAPRNQGKGTLGNFARFYSRYWAKLFRRQQAGWMREVMSSCRKNKANKIVCRWFSVLFLNPHQSLNNTMKRSIRATFSCPQRWCEDPQILRWISHSNIFFWTDYNVPWEWLQLDHPTDTSAASHVSQVESLQVPQVWWHPSMAVSTEWNPGKFALLSWILHGMKESSGVGPVCLDMNGNVLFNTKNDQLLSSQVRLWTMWVESIYSMIQE